MQVAIKNHEKIRETLFTFKQDSAELVSFDEIFRRSDKIPNSSGKVLFSLIDLTAPTLLEHFWSIHRNRFNPFITF